MSDDKIDSFAQAFVEATRLQDQYRQELMSAPGTEVQRIQERAQAEILATIENQQGISVAEFERIQVALSSDAQLRDRVAAAVERHVSKGPADE